MLAAIERGQMCKGRKSVCACVMLVGGQKRAHLCVQTMPRARGV
jgi:hypothetical protein